jgi:hypothetical protein
MRAGFLRENGPATVRLAGFLDTTNLRAWSCELSIFAYFYERLAPYWATFAINWAAARWRVA